MGNINVNGREKSVTFYADSMGREMWEILCNVTERNPEKYDWLRVNFNLSDVNDEYDFSREGLPGCEWMPIIYADDNLVIRQRNSNSIYSYHKTNYTSPLLGSQRYNWLSSGSWCWINGWWYLDHSDYKLATLEEVIKYIKNNKED